MTTFARRRAELGRAGVTANLYTIDTNTRAGAEWLLTVKHGDHVITRRLTAPAGDRKAAELEAVTLLTNPQPKETHR